jgi:hypothetical protein
MNKPKDKRPYYFREIYTDEYNTLCQMIIYRSNDEREKIFRRSTINPNLKILKTKAILNKHFEIIDVMEGEKDE